MTTPNGAIVFDATYGSDTQASGLGPATALYGSGATTDGTAVVTGITTTGVTAGDLLWVQTSSGRQFSVIASVDSGTQVTCDDTFAVGLGQTWAIGGKRATWDNIDSRNLFSSDGFGLTITTETDQSLTSELDISVKCLVAGAGAIRTVDQSADAANFGETTEENIYVSNLKFTNSNASSTSNSRGYRRNGDLFARNCIFGDATNQLYHGMEHINGRTNFFLDNCVIQHCIGSGYSPSHGISQANFINCVFHSNGQYGASLNSDTVNFHNCVFANNTGSGIYYPLSNNGSARVNGCIFYKNGGSGIQGRFDGPLTVIDSVFYENTSYGFNASVTPDKSYVFGNFQDSATTHNNFNIGSDVTTLTADIFTDGASDDYSLNSTAGGGAVLRAASFSFASTQTRPFRWLDAATSSSGGGGSSYTNVASAKFTRLE